MRLPISATESGTCPGQYQWAQAQRGGWHASWQRILSTERALSKSEQRILETRARLDQPDGPFAPFLPGPGRT